MAEVVATAYRAYCRKCCARRQKQALQRTATETEMASIDKRLLVEFPAYFALARPAALRLDKRLDGSRCRSVDPGTRPG